MGIPVGYFNGFGRIGASRFGSAPDAGEKFELRGINPRKADLDYMEQWRVNMDSVSPLPSMESVEHDGENLIVNGAQDP
ncbi:MAG: hypothetical protein ACLUJG_08545 [Lawsonibacter sp.]